MFDKFFKSNSQPEESKENLMNQYIDSTEVPDTHEDTIYNFRDLKLDFLYGSGKRRILHRPFGKFKRKIIFALVFFINILINIDHGAIPAATTILKRDLSIDNVSLGIIGSLVYLGLVLGALSASLIFQSYSSKWVVSVSLILSCLFLYIFTVVSSVFMLAVSRTGCGFFQIFCFIYFPVWVDQFGVNESRTLWISYLQLGVPLGTMIGYVLEAYFINTTDDWRGCFYIQILFLLASSVLLILTPDKFFSKHYKRSKTSNQEIEKEYELSKLGNNLKSPMIASKGNGVFHTPKPNNKGNERLNQQQAKFGRPSLYSMFSLIDESEEASNFSYFNLIKEIFSNIIYLYTLFAICCLLFIITGIQFWISDYMQVVLQMDPKKVFITFAVVCITAPVLGVLAGGYLIQKLGGYTDNRALDASFYIAILAALSGIFLPLIDFIPLFVLLIWLLLFFGGSIVPGLTGILISSVPNKTKEVANSITHLCYNLLGYLPSPVLYGLICKYTGGTESRFGLAFILCWSLFGVGFLHLARRRRRLLINNSIPLFDIEDSAVNQSERRKTINANALGALYGRLSSRGNTQMTE